MLTIFRTNLRKSFTLLFGFQLLLIVVVSLLILLLFRNQNTLARSRDTQYESYQLADQLRQSSDDLTRLVRTYVATGNPEFEREYWAVLDIRNGKAPRPLDYDNIYWDFVSATGQKPRADGEAVSLHELMVKEGFTKEELEKLALAQKYSDDLVKAETVAMNAMKGLFEDSNGNFTVKKEPDQKMAAELVNNEAYHTTKAAIMKPLDDFYLMFEARTSDAVNQYLNTAKNLFSSLIVIVTFILLISIYSFGSVRKQILERELAEKKSGELAENLKKETQNKIDLANNLEKSMKEKAEMIGSLDKKIEERTKKLEFSEARARKDLEESQRINKMMISRELKMIELKKENEQLTERLKGR
jgi:methyl-accepting chemotaxis protein